MFAKPAAIVCLVLLFASLQLMASTQLDASGCPSGEDLNPPTRTVRRTDYVEVENTGLFSNRIRLHADGRVTWRGGQVFFPASIEVKPEEARALISAYRSPEVWRLCRDYTFVNGDTWTVTTIQTGGKVRRISEGNRRAPELLHDLNRRIEKLIVPERLTLMRGTPVSAAFVQLIGDPERNVDAVRDLIGLDINLIDRYGWSLLMYLTQEPASLAQMKSMIASGLKVNARSNTGETPLMLAASSRYFDPNWISTLLEAGADVNPQDDDGQTALIYLVNRLAIHPNKSLGDPVAMLRSRGARTDTRDKAGLTVFNYWDEIVKSNEPSGGMYQWIDDSLRN